MGIFTSSSLFEMEWHIWGWQGVKCWVSRFVGFSQWRRSYLSSRWWSSQSYTVGRCHWLFIICSDVFKPYTMRHAQTHPYHSLPIGNFWPESSAMVVISSSPSGTGISNISILGDHSAISWNTTSLETTTTCVSAPRTLDFYVTRHTQSTWQDRWDYLVF